MAKYVFSFRGHPDRVATPDEEAAWGRWFEQIGSSIAERGNRVGHAQVVGAGPSVDTLTGYIVVNAKSLEAATTLAEGCPGLRHGGGVEVGAIVES
jgi:hypothetical protein